MKNKNVFLILMVFVISLVLVTTSCNFPFFESSPQPLPTDQLFPSPTPSKTPTPQITNTPFSPVSDSLPTPTPFQPREQGINLYFSDELGNEINTDESIVVASFVKEDNTEHKCIIDSNLFLKEGYKNGLTINGVEGYSNIGTEENFESFESITFSIYDKASIIGDVVYTYGHPTQNEFFKIIIRDSKYEKCPKLMEMQIPCGVDINWIDDVCSDDIVAAGSPSLS
jgi:hypothetical protein